MRSVDVAVVGAGPAGIAAALASAGNGVDTLLVDENPAVGGQLRWRIAPTMDHDPGFGLGIRPGPDVARQLASRLAGQKNLTVETGTVAWGLFEENVLGISREDSAEQVQARSIVLATGSTDITMPFPGWTLPGVLTARAVQIFMHVHRVRPGIRWAILGDTLEAVELGEDLRRAGAEVVVEWSDIERFRASGTNRLAHAECAGEVHEVDGLAIALGRQPDAELAQQAQADVVFDLDLGGFVPRRTPDGLTSVPGVFVAGDAAGIGDLAEVVAEGHLAGLAASGAKDSDLDLARGNLASVSSPRRRQAIERLRLAAPAS